MRDDRERIGRLVPGKHKVDEVNHQGCEQCALDQAPPALPPPGAQRGLVVGGPRERAQAQAQYKSGKAKEQNTGGELREQSRTEGQTKLQNGAARWRAPHVGKAP